jgi:hypothetical protein
MEHLAQAPFPAEVLNEPTISFFLGLPLFGNADSKILSERRISLSVKLHPFFPASLSIDVFQI